MRYFLQKSPLNSGSFAENDLQLKAFYGNRIPHFHENFCKERESERFLKILVRGVCVCQRGRARKGGLEKREGERGVCVRGRGWGREEESIRVDWYF